MCLSLTEAFLDHCVTLGSATQPYRPQTCPNIIFKFVLTTFCCCCSVAQSCPTLSNPMDFMQHTRPSCPSLSPRVCSDLCPLSQWWFLTLSSSAVPFFFCLQSFLALGPFPMCWLFTSASQKYWSFSISPSSEYSGLISFRIDWFDLLVVQGTLRSLPQHHSLKASILWYSVFFRVQLLHLYMIIGKTIALTIWTFTGKVMSLLFNMLSRFVTAFLPSPSFQGPSIF